MLDVTGIKKKLPSNTEEYVIIKNNGKPMPVSNGDHLYILGKNDTKNGVKLFDNCIYKKDGALHFNNASVKVHWELVEFIKGKKITIQHFKNKTRHKVRKGYRNKYSIVKINKIEYQS